VHREALRDVKAVLFGVFSILFLTVLYLERFRTWRSQAPLAPGFRVHGVGF
jgi:hypothetical protein